MIQVPAAFDRDELSCRLCIPGAGSAGITLAREPGRRLPDVLPVAGGTFIGLNKSVQSTPCVFAAMNSK